MAGRIRSLKPEILSDERTAKLSDAAWRLFVSTFVLADDPGNLRAHGQLLVSEVWWARPERDAIDIRAILEELERAELITFYRVRGQAYAHINGWYKHQKIDRPGPALVPGPPDADQETPVTAKGVPHTRRATDSRVRPTVCDGFATDPDPDLDRDQDLDPQSPARPTDGRTPAAQEDEALLIFPTVRGKRSGAVEWRLTRSVATELREGYPDLDVLAEARKARAWILAKPERRKTSGGMMSFLVGWLGRSQNSGKGARTGTDPAAQTHAAKPQRAPPPELCTFHREIADKASSDPYRWCALCRKFGARPRRNGTSEPEAIAGEPGGTS